ncbi:MAG: TolC family protein [Polaribacter sp.]|nr:TolC family protein [Polaribacter sp.]MDG1811774.1 TolC family protein [Polaribacter sp.]MDG1994681.1 TolC family protein [Polaribacter sp.]
MKHKIYTLSLIIFLSFQVKAQEVLTKKEALQITLENNYGIKIANNNLEIAKNNSAIFNTNRLPTVSVASGANYRSDNQTITRQDNTVTEVDDAVTKSYNASLNLNYTIFDGLGRKYNYAALKENYNLSEIQAKETIENTYLQLFNLYFQIARLSENNTNLKEALTISKQRFERAKYKHQYGQSTKLELLNAEVDVNNDSIALINSKQQYLNAKRSLNIVLGAQKGVDYEVETAVTFSQILNFEELLTKAKAANVLLKKTEKNLAISQFNIKINKASYLPRVGLTTSYGWNKSENPATSFLAQSSSNGLNAGLNLTWNIFDGGGTKTRVANAKIAVENQQILLQQQNETLENTLKNTWSLYNNKLFVLSAQEKNVASSQNNFDRTKERYNLGQVTSIEFRQAQINFINAKTAYNNTKFEAKLIELELLQLSGELLNTEI